MTRINTRLRKIEEKKELLKILDEFEEYNTWSAGNEDVMWVCNSFIIIYFSHLPPLHLNFFFEAILSLQCDELIQYPLDSNIFVLN